LKQNWERILFGIVGFICLGFTLSFLINRQVAGASAVFAMAVFSFFYSNLSRFKKFKGLGFEAELWENKQKEAADLISRLKSVVAIYTREIVMGNVMRGRWGGGVDESWQKRWALLEELKGQHSELGQDIDFTELHRDVENVFIFDLCHPLANAIYQSIEEGKSLALNQARRKAGSTATDIDQYGRHIKDVNSIESGYDDLFDRAKTENIAQSLLHLFAAAKLALENRYNVQCEIDPNTLSRLTIIKDAIRIRPVVITPELLSWTETGH
jgi:hypothetical protein